MALLPLQNDRQNQTHAHQTHAQLLQLACQGNAPAIATLMNRHLKPRQITAKVAWEGTCLHILLEAAQVPQPEPLASVIHKTVLKIQVEKLRSLKVSFRQRGQHQYAWSQQRAINHSPLSTPHSPLPHLPADRVPLIATAHTPLADWLNQKAQTDLEPRLPLATAGIEEQALRFLRFSFSLAETALLPLMSIRQVVNVPFQNILPVPAMPTAVVGIYNFRGEMLWLVDLGLQIGFQGVTTGSDRLSPQRVPQLASQLSESSRHHSSRTAIVIQAQGRSLGLLVPAVVDIESHQSNQLQPPAIDLFPPGLLPFMQSYLVRSSSPVLDASALIHDRRFQIHAA